MALTVFQRREYNVVTPCRVRTEVRRMEAMRWEIEDYSKNGIAYCQQQEGVFKRGGASVSTIMSGRVSRCTSWWRSGVSSGWSRGWGSRVPSRWSRGW